MDERDPFRNLAEARPRLMANAAAVARVKAAIAGNPAGEKMRDKIIEQANDIEYAPYVEPNFKAWNRLRLNDLAAARLALYRLQTLGMAWFMTGNPRYVTRARKELKTICEFPVWQAPDHFLDAAEMTHAAAIGYDWFFDQLSPDERRTIALAIVEKGLKPGRAQLKGPANPDWPRRVTNWNLVCNGGLIVGCLGIAERDGKGEIDPALTREVFELGRQSVPTGIRGYAPDGTWDEGPGYWTYATEYLAYMLSAMRTALNDEFDLGDRPGLAHTGFYRLHAEGPPVSTGSLAGLLFNYSDSPETHSGSWVMRWLDFRYDKPVFTWVANHRKKPEAMDLLWFSPVGPPPDGISPDAHLRGIADLVMMRGDWDAKDAKWLPWAAPAAAEDLGITYLGIRAGRNTEENHHGHLDLGSFVLDSDGVRWAVDIPPADGAKPPCVADYDLPGYFDLKSGQRFTYYRTSTVGHNTLLVNGRNQAMEVDAKIIAFQSVPPKLTRTLVDLTPAYPDCLSATRGFALIDLQHVLIVDEITTRGAMPVTWQWHTRAGVTIEGRTARLHHEDKPNPAKELYLHLVEPANAVFEEQSTAVPPPQAPNTGIRKLAIRIASAAIPTRIAVYVSAKRDPFAQLPASLTSPLASWGQLHPNS